jgi:hypothetical protein
MKTTNITADDLVDKQYVLETREMWMDNMGEYPTIEQLTLELWYSEEATNEYELDEDDYYELVEPFVKKLLEDQE